MASETSSEFGGIIPLSRALILLTSAAKESRQFSDRLLAASHLLEGLDSEHLQPLLQNPASQMAQEQTAGALLRLGFEHWAILEKPVEVSRKVIKIIAQKIRSIFLGRGFEHQPEIEQVLRERRFLGSF